MGQELVYHPKIFIVEDEFVLAEDLAAELTGLGAEIVAFAQNASRALQLARSESLRIDAAVLDIDLNGQTSFAIVDVLLERAVPVVFCTGYLGIDIPERFNAIPCLTKPVKPRAVMAALRAELETAAVGSASLPDRSDKFLSR